MVTVMKLPGIRPNSNMWKTLQTKPDINVLNQPHACKQDLRLFDEILFRVGFAHHLTVHGQQLEMPFHIPFTPTWLTPERWRIEQYITLHRMANNQPLSNRSGVYSAVWLRFKERWLLCTLSWIHNNLGSRMWEDRSFRSTHWVTSRVIIELRKKLMNPIFTRWRRHRRVIKVHATISFIDRWSLYFGGLWMYLEKIRCHKYWPTTS